LNVAPVQRLAFQMVMNVLADCDAFDDRASVVLGQHPLDVGYLVAVAL
jgi:hypothetical protein